MKYRNGFVSNSSSSSFVVSLSILTEKEKRKVLSYKEYSEDESDGHFRDHWSIRVDEQRGVMYGFTSMDNGHLSKYLGKKLGKKLEGKFVFND